MSTPIKTTAEIAENYRRMIVETARRSMAMQRQFPDVVCRWRRMAKTGPNADLVVVFLWREGQEPTTEIWPLARLERLAAQIPNAEVRAELERRGKRHFELELS